MKNKIFNRINIIIAGAIIIISALALVLIFSNRKNEDKTDKLVSNFTTETTENNTEEETTTIEQKTQEQTTVAETTEAQTEKATPKPTQPATQKVQPTDPAPVIQQTQPFTEIPSLDRFIDENGDGSNDLLYEPEVSWYVYPEREGQLKLLYNNDGTPDIRNSIIGTIISFSDNQEFFLTLKNLKTNT